MLSSRGDKPIPLIDDFFSRCHSKVFMEPRLGSECPGSFIADAVATRTVKNVDTRDRNMYKQIREGKVYNTKYFLEELSTA